MPKQHKTGDFKQKNKPFKGGSKRNIKERLGKIVKKQIQKQSVPQPVPKEVKQQQMKQQLIQDEHALLIKQTKQPKIIAVVPFNEGADTMAIKKMINDALDGVETPLTSYITQSIFSRVDPSKQIPFVKQSLQFIYLSRDLESILDACKVADLIVPVLSCKNVNLEGISLDPLTNAQAFDSVGYRALSCLRIQGLLEQVCVVQDLQHINASKRTQVKKLFTRYFQTEFGDDATVVTLENKQSVLGLLRFLQTGQTPQEWRDIRGYMLPEELNYVDGELIITGIWRGKSGLSPNQLIHITGLDDYQISRIKLMRAIEEELVRNPEIGESLDPLSHKAEDINDQFLDQLQGLGIQEEPEMMIQEEVEDQVSDVSYGEEDEEQYAKSNDVRKQVPTEMEKRAEDELEFEDEVEYNMDVQLRERYSKYTGLKNFSTATVDPYVETFLPDEVDKIFNIRNLPRVKQDVLQEMKQTPQFPAGVRIQIFVHGFPQHLVAKLTEPNKIIVVSGNLKHERKMTQMHIKFKRAQDYESPIDSKSSIVIQAGFRRATVEPIYSRILSHTNKTKYIRSIKDNQWYMASFYFFCTFPPQKILAFKTDFDYRNGLLLGQGEVLKCEAFHVIMKRVLLTGYPYKINKRKAVVRLMFFNPTDIRYFKPVDLTTKLGLKGNIIEPLGTHGLLKAMFNNFVKPNDTICLPLYKRVHPRFPKQN